MATAMLQGPRSMVDGQQGHYSDNHIAAFENKPNVTSNPDDLTYAYGDWQIPELVKKLRDSKVSAVLEAKVLRALAELCAQSERAGEAVKAGVVPAILASDAIGEKPSEPAREALVLDLLVRLSVDTKGRQALLDAHALRTLKVLADQRRSLVAVARVVGSLCVLREGATAAHRAGYSDLLGPALGFQQDGAAFSKEEATAWLKVLAKMLRESDVALTASTLSAKGPSAVAFLKQWREQTPAIVAVPEPEADHLNAGLLVFHALTVEDRHKEVFVSSGVVDEICLTMVLTEDAADGNMDISPWLSWETKSHLLSLLAQLAVIVPGKLAIADKWLPMIANVLKNADSELLQGAALQALLHVVEHPKARQYLLDVDIQKEVEEVVAQTNSPFVKRIAKSFTDLLNWTP